MKKLLSSGIIAVILVTVMVTGCNKSFLEKEPLGVLSPSVLQNQDGVEALLIAAYSELSGYSDGLTNWESPGSNWVYGDVAADDAHKGSDPSDQDAINYIEEHQGLFPTNDYINQKFEQTYDAVSRCNDVIRFATAATDIATDLQNEIIAEARFLRGYFHLEAIKMYDYVPYVDETNTDGLVENQPASTAAGDATKTWGQMGGDGVIPWDKVEADFQFAKQNLPNDPRNGDVGRATKYVAEAYLAKLYLFQGKFAQALPELNDIIASKKFSLNPLYQTCFEISGNNSPEAVYSIQSSVNDGASSSPNANFGEILNAPYNNGPGGCCGFDCPSQDLANAFKTKNGLPYLSSLGLQYNDPSDPLKNDEGIASSDPFTVDTRPVDPRIDWTMGRRGIPYWDWGIEPGADWIRSQSVDGPYTPKKLVYKKSEQGTQSNPNGGNGWGGLSSSNKFELVRYADVLLMAAECEVEVNNDLSKAMGYVNQVRARAANPAGFVTMDDGTPAANYEVSVYPAGTPAFATKDNAIEAIRMERRIELAEEGLRFWDLKRWGTLKSTLETYWKNESTTKAYVFNDKTFDDKDVRYPIGQTPIDESNGTLHQVPGY